MSLSLDLLLPGIVVGVLFFGYDPARVVPGAVLALVLHLAMCHTAWSGVLSGISCGSINTTPVIGYAHGSQYVHTDPVPEDSLQQREGDSCRLNHCCPRSEDQWAT